MGQFIREVLPPSSRGNLFYVVAASVVALCAMYSFSPSDSVSPTAQISPVAIVPRAGVEFCGKMWPLETTSLSCNDPRVVDVAPIAKLKKLVELDLSGHQYAPGPQMSDLEPLSSLSQLQRLDISFAKVRTIEPLGKLPNLKHLDMAFTQVLDDLAPLTTFSSLDTLYVGSYRPKIIDRHIRALRGSRPKLDVRLRYLEGR